MAGRALQWQLLQDSHNSDWIDVVSLALTSAQDANSSELPSALSNVSVASTSIPIVGAITPEQPKLESERPSEWLERLDSGDNLSQEIGGLLGQMENLLIEKNTNEIGQIMAVTQAQDGQLIPLSVLQEIDYRAAILNCMPVQNREDPWNMSGPVLTSYRQYRTVRLRTCFT